MNLVWKLALYLRNYKSNMAEVRVTVNRGTCYMVPNQGGPDVPKPCKTCHSGFAHLSRHKEELGIRSNASDENLVVERFTASYLVVCMLNVLTLFAFKRNHT